MNKKKEKLIKENRKENRKLRELLDEKQVNYQKTLMAHGVKDDANIKDPQLKKKLRKEQLIAATTKKKLVENNSEYKKLKKPSILPQKLEVPRNFAMYDYPLVMGKPMTPGQRKKYRRSIRKYLKTMNRMEAEKYAMQAVANYCTHKVKGTRKVDEELGIVVEEVASEKIARKSRLPKKKATPEKLPSSEVVVKKKKKKKTAGRKRKYLTVEEWLQKKKEEKKKAKLKLKL